VKSVSGKHFCKVLEKNNWSLLRINGSHHIYGKQNSMLRITVPVHGNADLTIGLLRSILKLAELTEEDL
jgi:predicted RNA binding protein YcfA (HicA-like mRNA interferase family)